MDRRNMRWRGSWTPEFVTDGWNIWSNGRATTKDKTAGLHTIMYSPPMLSPNFIDDTLELPDTSMPHPLTISASDRLIFHPAGGHTGSVHPEEGVM
jgi:hypothetical protein